MDTVPFNMSGGVARGVSCWSSGKGEFETERVFQYDTKPSAVMILSQETQPLVFQNQVEGVEG